VACEHQFERFQRMSDDPVKDCEKCGEPVKRLLFPVAIQFKGDGFYTTDYARRSSLKSASQQGSGSGESEAGPRPDSDSSTGVAKPEAAKTEAAKPEASKATASTSTASAHSD
jgi:putative FmdB family regulatory protein